jgi:hypothetical protein
LDYEGRSFCFCCGDEGEDVLDLNLVLALHLSITSPLATHIVNNWCNHSVSALLGILQYLSSLVFGDVEFGHDWKNWYIVKMK